MATEKNRPAALLSVKEVASALQISTRTVWRLVSSGELIKPLRVGRNTRWRRAELEEWIQLGCPRVDNFQE